MLDKQSKRMTNSRRGASLLAYGLMVGLVAVVALGAITSSGSSVTSLFGQVAGKLDGVADGAVAPPASSPEASASASASPSASASASALPVAASCAALLAAQPSLAGMDGNYIIDPDGSGGVSPFTAYCDMTNAGGGLTLVGSMNVGNYSPSKGTSISLTDSNNILADAEWAALRDASSHFMMTVDTLPGYVRVPNATAVTANCSNLATLTPWRTTRGLDRYHYAHNENAGCDGLGGDYCYFNYNIASDTMGAYNQCSSAPSGYVQISSDGISWSTPAVYDTVTTSNPAKVWLFVK